MAKQPEIPKQQKRELPKSGHVLGKNTKVVLKQVAEGKDYWRTEYRDG